MTSVAAPAVPAARTRVAGFWERSFHVGVVLVMTVIVLLAAFARVPLMESETWLVVGRRILLPFPPDGVSG